MPEKAKVPAIRFKDFTDAWEQRKVNDIFHEIFSGNRLPKTSLVEGEVPYIIAKVTNNGEFMKIDNNSLDYHENKMKLFPSPSITFSIDNPEAIFVQKYPFFTSNIMRVLHNSSLSYNQNIFFHLCIKSLTTSFNWSIKFSGPVVMDSIISAPINEKGDAINFDEIERVGGFFNNLDNLISLHQRKLLKLKNVKKAMLEKMFPKNGSKVPEIRFAGFTDAWEQRKLGEAFTQTVGYVNPKLENIELWSLTLEKGLTPKTERYIRDFLVLKEDKYKAVRPNDVVYNPMNMTLGAIGYNDMPITVAVSGYYVTMKPSNSIDGYYIKTWMQLAQSIELYKAHATGSLLEKQRVQYPTFSEIKFTVPSLVEQQKIGTFFRDLDNLITLHQRKYEKLQNLKKACLEKMFV